MEHTLTALTTTLTQFISNHGVWIGLVMLAAIILSATMAGRQIENRKMTKLSNRQFRKLKQR
jgi:uncharacterized membrane protein (DUF441 family)